MMTFQPHSVEDNIYLQTIYNRKIGKNKIHSDDQSELAVDNRTGNKIAHVTATDSRKLGNMTHEPETGTIFLHVCHVHKSTTVASDFQHQQTHGSCKILRDQQGIDYKANEMQ